MLLNNLKPALSLPSPLSSATGQSIMKHHPSVSGRAGGFSQSSGGGGGEGGAGFVTRWDSTGGPKHSDWEVGSIGVPSLIHASIDAPYR